jgi:tRNA U34 5-methylaminomethyl-2-thiouridine-forming methyltransferase MnmC
MKFRDFEPRLTDDGSLTLYSDALQESYHSINGAIQESRHVFIEAGLLGVQKTPIRVLEVGFGTGLNALLTWNEALKNNLHVEYESLEAYPVSNRLLESLHYEFEESLLPEQAFNLLHESEWNTPIELDAGVFRLTKWLQDFTTFSLQGSYDLIYFDAFSPDKQPEMWSDALFEKLYRQLTTHGMLVTYCAKGEVRRCLQRAGFRTERLPGPPGKREMLRAIKD